MHYSQGMCQRTWIGQGPGLWCCVAGRFKDRAQPPVGITVLESSCPAMLDAFLALVLQQFGINGPGDSCLPR